MRREHKILDDWLFPAGIFVTGMFISSVIGPDKIDEWAALTLRAVGAGF